MTSASREERLKASTHLGSCILASDALQCGVKSVGVGERVRVRRKTYVGAKLEVAGAAHDVLVDGVVEVTVQDLL